MIGIALLYRLKVYIVVEAMKPKWLLRLILKLRQNFPGVIFVPVEKGVTLARASSNLKDGKIVLILVDVFRDDRNGIECRIGNARVRFPTEPITLALKNPDAIFVPVFPSWDEKRGEFKTKVVIGEPFELIRTGNMQYDIESNTRRLIEEVLAPHIQRHYSSWMRLLQAKLEPVEPDQMIDVSRDPVARVEMRMRIQKALTKD